MSRAISRRMALRSVLGIGVAAAMTDHASACSRIFWNDNPSKLVGRTLDWDHNFNEALWVLPAGMARTGAVADNPAQWTSRFGSVVISAYDRAAVEGINERGFVAQLLFLDGTRFEPRDKTRPGIAFHQWAQYYLDNFASVQEAMGAFNQVQIVQTAFGEQYPNGIPLHVALADRSGDSAIIEFIDGQPVIHFGRRFQVMTNDPTYEEQLANLRRYRPFGGTIDTIPGGAAPDERFVRAAYTLRYLPKTRDDAQAVANMMSLLNSVSVPFGYPYAGVSDTYPTWWRSIIDLSSPTYYVQTTVTPNVFWLDLGKVKVERGAPTRRLGIFDPSLLGEISARLVEAKPSL